MARIIKSLVNGEYLYPTVKDIGNLDNLNTTVKTDIVSAINDIVQNGVAIKDGVTSSEVDDKIETATNNLKAQTEADLAEAKSQLNTRITDAQTSLSGDIADAQKELKDHNDNIQTLNDKAQSLSTDLGNTKTNLDDVKSDLANVKIGQNDISQTLDTVKGQIETKAEKANLDAAQEQIEKNTADILINAEGLDSKATKEDLTLANQNITKVQSDLSQQADEISGKVSEDKLTNKMNDFQVKKANLLLGTRDWYNWVISNPAYVSVTDSLYNACYWASLTKSTETISMSVSGLTSGNTYTLSVVAKTIKSGDTINVQEKTAGILKTKNNDQNVTTDPQTYSVTFVASSDTINIAFGLTGSVSSGNALLINEAKLETGSEVTYWEMNSADNFERIEHSEAQQKITSDQISSVTLKQTQLGDEQEEQSASISQLGDKIVIAQNDITSLNGSVQDVNTKIDSKAGELQATFSEEINQQIDNISDSNNNEILNSGFTSGLNRWQSVSAKANVVSDSNNKNWVDFKQSGLSADSPISIESNYFEAKDNDVIVVAFDMNQLTDVTLDNNNVLILEVFNTSNSRIDYKELQISDCEVIGSNPKRLKYKYQISHSDASKFAIRAELKRNGHLQFSNFLAVKSTINNGAYTTNAQDNVDVTVKQQNQITANTEGLQLKADKTSVDTLSQTVTNQTAQISVLNDEVAEKTAKTDFDNLTGRVTSAEQKVTANADGLNSTVSKMSTLQDQVNNSAVGTNLISGSTLEKNWYAQSPATASLDAINFVTFTKSTTSSARQGYMHTIQSGFLPSQYYTLSAEIYIVNVSGSGTDNDIHFRSYGSNSAATGNYVALLDTSKVSVWQKLVVTGKTPSDVSGGLDFGLSISGGTTGVFKIRNFKLELGSVATDYSTCPSENATVTSVTNVSQKADQIAADLATSNGDITQLKARATGWDSSIASANGKINTLQATSDGYATNISAIQNQVNNSAVGTNLLYGTSMFSPWYGTTSFSGSGGTAGLTTKIETDSDGDTAWHLSGTVTQNSVRGFYNNQLSKNYPAQYALSVSVKGTFANTTVNAFTVEGNTGYVSNGLTLSTSYQRWITTGNISSGTGAASVLYFNVVAGDTVDIWVKKWKLEKGLVATDYSTNPEDNATTNYVNNQITATASTLSANLTSTTTTLKTYADNSANNATAAAIATAASDATTKANAVQSNLDNQQIGGTNLIDGTGQPFIMGYGIPNTTWNGTEAYVNLSSSRPTANGNEILPQAGSPWNNNTGIVPIKGATYTQSIYIATDCTISSYTGNFITWFSSKGHDLQPVTLVKVGDNLYRITSTKTWAYDNVGLRVFDLYLKTFDLVNSGTYIAFYHPKLEMGNTVTDWSPSIGDIQADATTKANAAQSNAITQSKTYADTQITATAGTFSANLSSTTTTLKTYADTSATNAKNAAVSTAASDATTKANNAQSNAVSTASSDATTKANNAQSNAIASAKTYADTQISATAGTFNVKTSAIQTQLDNSAVGTNLLLGTSKSASLTGTNTANQTMANYLLANGYNVSKLATVYGTQFTVSFDWSVSGSSPSGTYSIQWNNVPWGMGLSGTVSSSNTSGHFSKTFSVGTTTANIATMIGFRLDNFVGTITFSNVKLEKGSVATDWSLAPNDTDYTNMFSMDSNGITLDAHGVNNSNKTILLRGDHVKIDSSNPVVIPTINANVITGTAVAKNMNLDFTNGSIYVNASGNQTWIDQNGFHNTNGSGTDTYIKNGVISTNVIQANSKLHIGNLSTTDTRLVWGTDVDVNGMSFTVPVKVGSTNNASDYQSEIQGYIKGFGWDYKTATMKGTGGSGLVMGLAQQTVWGDPYGGDYIGIGQFVPTDSAKTMASADFQPAIAYWATGVGGAYGANTVSITPPLYVDSGINGTADLIMSSTGAHDAVVGSSSGQGNIGLRGSIFYWDSKSGGTRMIYADSNKFTVNTMFQGGGVILNNNNNLRATSGGDFYIDGNGGSGGNAVLHVKSVTQTSLLSAKTNIVKLDAQDAIDAINSTDIYKYSFKDDVKQGINKRYASYIIDDVNEVSQYTEPDEFLASDKKGRDDGTQLSYLTVMIQEMYKKMQSQQDRIEKLEAQLNE
ncbi:hypothetical protein [Liquorilactobacillus mali]|uniref:Peptidase S74 domain-containing protein n=1 Tax=Liquorilactobacillus mali KCTC 3596 = DSM 20444 TaxID=1046596 RepID=J1F0X0_9LACO|nr:hypothetical protein [Liquorilactobacillus mali]EJE97758.1 prophage protein [Liquorilactobacillus mali KCTC 3596 = DSM 20444]KRN10831.1 hypothetical protein FD00_GL002074 [Liquorilactobacillus mali KCTC 3596 = DSM 20444]